VKRSGRDESVWVAVHMCMEAMLGISLYIYLYIKLAKTLCLIISYVFSSTKLEKQEDRTGSAWKGEVAKTMYTHVSKCKNNKILKRRVIEGMNTLYMENYKLYIPSYS
jgi:hypothetical protein